VGNKGLDNLEPSRDEREEDRHRQDLRAEYAALSSYFNTVIGFRFTTLSFYLATVGFLCKDEPLTDNKAILLFLITLSVYLIQIRNDTLYRNLAHRAKQIEAIWGTKEHFFSHMMEPEPKDKPRILARWIEFSFPITHGVAVDILFLGMLLFAVLSVASRHGLLWPVVRFFWACVGVKVAS